MAEPDPVSLYTDPKWLRSAQVAAILQVSPKTIQRWAREGKLPFQRTLGGHRRYRASSIREIADGAAQPATVGPAAGGGSR
jgi:excisionase family DNA binding protein